MNQTDLRVPLTRLLAVALTAVATILAGAGLAQADTPSQPGAVDPSFVQTTSGLNSDVDAIVVQPDGKIVVGGYFSSFNGTPAQHIARFNPDGSRDTSFALTGSGLDGQVWAVARQPDGKLLVGGDFTKYNGNPAPYLIRLNADGSQDTSFAQSGSGLNSTVQSIALESGNVVVGGWFTQYNGAPAPYVIRLQSNGHRDATFNHLGAGLNNGVNSVVVQPNDKILLGGAFSSFNGISAPRVIRLTNSGVADGTFSPGTGFDGTVASLGLDSAGRIIAGGSFTQYDGVDSPNIVRLQSSGARDVTFGVGTGFNRDVQTVLVQPDDKVLVGGWFEKYKGVAVPYLVRLNTNGTIDGSFAQTGSGLSSSVAALALQSDNKILVGGEFNSYNQTDASHLLRLNADGARDTSLGQPGSGINGGVNDVAVQPDGKILLGGWFTSYNGNPAPHLVRINPDGTRDNSFVVSGSGTNDNVYVILVQPDGKILVGGAFTDFGGVAMAHLMRLNPDGSRDVSFNQTGSGLDGWVESLALQPDGKILVGGWFRQYNGVDVNYLVRLNADGSRDGSFSQTGTKLNSGVATVTLQPDGKILAGGWFDAYNGIPAQKMIRLNANGSRDVSFLQTATGLSGTVFTSVLQPDGKVIVGGPLDTYNGEPVHGIMRMNANGSRDGSFVASAGEDARVGSLALQADGKILAAGSFTTFNGAPAPYVLRLNSDGTTDTSFAQTGTGLNNGIGAMALQPDGKIVIGGWFTSYNSAKYAYVTRLLGDPSPAPTPTKPAKPKKVKVKATATKVKVTWKASAGATSYPVQARGITRKGKAVLKKKTPTATSANLKFTKKSVLKKKTKVRVCVRARNVAGTSAKTCVRSKVK